MYGPGCSAPRSQDGTRSGAPSLYCGSGYPQAVQIVVPGFMMGIRLLGGVAQRVERSSCLHFMTRGITNWCDGKNS
jgi:hypothetical protein